MKQPNRFSDYITCNMDYNTYITVQVRQNSTDVKPPGRKAKRPATASQVSDRAMKYRRPFDSLKLGLQQRHSVSFLQMNIRPLMTQSTMSNMSIAREKDQNPYPLSLYELAELKRIVTIRLKLH